MRKIGHILLLVSIVLGTCVSLVKEEISAREINSVYETVSGSEDSTTK
jgi:hypothetical protein